MPNDSLATRIANLCDQLRREPVFQMSLHSKELFHSNMLAWFCEAYPDSARQVLSQWVPQRDTQTHKIDREHRNLDLVIQIPGLAPVIIENKVFSPPDDAQLDGYSEKQIASLDNPSLLLLSLGSPSWTDSAFTSTNGRTWHHISYRDLTNTLGAEADLIPGFDGDVLRHYVTFVRALQEVVDLAGVVDPGEPIGLHPSTYEVLKVVRIHDAIGKLRSRSAIAAIRDETRSQFGDTEVIFGANFTDGNPLLEAFVRSASGDYVGWQYQNAQWRLAVKTERHNGKTDDLRKMRHDYVSATYGSWFDFAPLTRLLPDSSLQIPPKEVVGDFYRYDPDFVYRFRKLPDLTLAQMQTLSRHYLARARDLFR